MPDPQQQPIETPQTFTVHYADERDPVTVVGSFGVWQGVAFVIVRWPVGARMTETVLEVSRADLDRVVCEDGSVWRWDHGRPEQAATIRLTGRARSQ